MRHASSTARHPKRHSNTISKQERRDEKKKHKEVTLSKIVHNSKADVLKLRTLTALLERQEARGDDQAAAATAKDAARLQRLMCQDDLAITLLYRAIELDPVDECNARQQLAPLLLRAGRGDEAHTLLLRWGTDRNLTSEVCRLLLSLIAAPTEAKVSL